MDKVSVTAFVAMATQNSLQDEYAEYLKNNKWLPFCSWLGQQLDNLFVKETISGNH